MDIKNVLFELNKDNEFFSTSAILFDKRWILMPGLSLLMFLHEKEGLPVELINVQPYKLYDKNYYNIVAPYMKIILDAEVSKEFEHKIYPVKYIGLFSSKNISNLEGFPLKIEISNNKDNQELTQILSIFLLFDIELKQSFIKRKFNLSVQKFLNLCNQCKFSRGSEICVDSAPFGRRQLLTTQTKGIVANVIGKHSCFLLTDAATAPGSEGGIVSYVDKTKKKPIKLPVAIVLSSLNSWRGEHIGLTLSATLKPLLQELLYGGSNKGTEQDYRKATSFLTGVVDNCLAKVLCGNEWGTAVLWDRDSGTFVTASHVVKHANKNPLRLKWKDSYIPCKLLYRTTETVYDIAVLQSDAKHVKTMCQIPFAEKAAVKGKDVIAAGFPIFNSNSDHYATISRGNVTLCNESIIHTNCCVLPGASGGAILCLNGDLLGIIICNTTMTVKNTTHVYPKVNMAIPISAIKGPLENYLKTKDVAHLKKLNCVDQNVILRWKLFPAKL